MVANKASTNGRPKKKISAKAAASSARNGKKGGRPKVQINEQALFELAKIQCTIPEMASVLGCAESVLRARFSAVIQKGKLEGHSSLRRMMYLAAKGGNTGMMVWLSKNLLGYTDKQDMTSGGLPLIQIQTVREARM